MSPSVLAQIRWASWCPERNNWSKGVISFSSVHWFSCFFLCLFVFFLGYVSGCFPSSYFQYLSNTVQLSSITQATCRQCGWCWHVLYYCAFGFSSSLWGMTLLCLREFDWWIVAYKCSELLYHMVQDFILHHLVVIHHENMWKSMIVI